ncbi:MAG: hypothetical protein WA939_17500 [Nodosilinea sp.]
MNDPRYRGELYSDRKLKVGDRLTIDGEMIEVTKIRGKEVYFKTVLDLSGLPLPVRVGFKVLSLISGVKTHE